MTRVSIMGRWALLCTIGCGDGGVPGDEDTHGVSSTGGGDGAGEGGQGSATTTASSGGPGQTGGETSANGDEDSGPGEAGSSGGDTPDHGSTSEGELPVEDELAGYWVWETRMFADQEVSGEVDNGQAKMAFGTGNGKCHYIWNELTGSDFHTDCTYTIAGDMVTYMAAADPDGTAAGWSCAHPDWTSWSDRPAMQWGRYKFVGDRLWLGVNTYWGFGGGADGIPTNNSLKRFGYWESQAQAETVEAWIVYRRVTREEWFSTYAISTNCQGPPELCYALPGCGPGDKPYVD